MLSNTFGGAFRYEGRREGASSDLSPSDVAGLRKSPLTRLGPDAVRKILGRSVIRRECSVSASRRAHSLLTGIVDLGLRPSEFSTRVSDFLS